ncbi:hypothetical protein [Janibacter sp. GS2]|uniref:hypothetical protein n=1 Tax=Janibacter sp. GS2 TaxID=3442646 RepID=UPI003EBAB167
MSDSTYELLLEKLDKIWNGFGEDKVGKGSAFERPMASYLRTAPERQVGSGRLLRSQRPNHR